MERRWWDVLVLVMWGGFDVFGVGEGVRGAAFGGERGVLFPGGNLTVLCLWRQRKENSQRHDGRQHGRSCRRAPQRRRFQQRRSCPGQLKYPGVWLGFRSAMSGSNIVLPGRP
eukprot:3521301-Rhodomonas_salina.2